jgi:hypothetical protein
MLMRTKKLAAFIGWDRKKMGDDIATGHCGFVPPADGRRLWSVDDAAAAQFYMDGINAGQSVRIAGTAATLLRDGMRSNPEADQLTIIRLENGSTSTLPTDALDLASGYLSGGYLRTALTVDVRNLRARINRAIAADAEIIA